MQRIVDLPGFAIFPNLDPSEWRVGPYFVKDDDPGRLAFPIDKHHCNARGVAENGLLLAFADFAIYPIARQSLAEFRGVTVTFNATIAGEVRPGERVDAQGEVLAETRRLIFARGALTVGSRPLVWFSGVMRKLQRTPVDADADLPPPARAVPRGYRLHEDVLDCHGLVGPYYAQAAGDGPESYGIRVEPHHCNGSGAIHGGMLMALADSVVAMRSSPEGSRSVAFSAEFLRGGVPGDFLEARCTFSDTEDAAGAARGTLVRDGETVLNFAAARGPARSD